MRYVLCLAVCLSGCVLGDDLEVSLARQRAACVEAAHLIAYTGLEQTVVPQSPMALPSETHQDDSYGAAGGIIDNKAREIIDATIERAMAKAGLTWDEVKRTSASIAKINALFNSKDGSPSKVPASPVTSQAILIMIVGKNCAPCQRFKDAVFPGLQASGWTIGDYANESKDRIQVLGVDEYVLTGHQWGIENEDGTIAVPQFLMVVDGNHVVEKAKLQAKNGTLEIVGKTTRPMTANSVGQWINSYNAR